MVTFTYKNRDYVFRNPELGNSDDLSFQRINRNSRGGDLILYRDNQWPKTETQNITFNLSLEADLQRMYDLLKDSFGDSLTYTDHEGKTWSGIIQNPDAQGAQTSISNWTINIIFEGDLV